MYFGVVVVIVVVGEVEFFCFGVFVVVDCYGVVG